MKKALSLLAVIAMAGIVSCGKDPVVAVINASDVTVEEGKTVKINATTNSTAIITYSSDNNAVATVTAAGEVVGIKAGTANITLKVAAVEGQFTAAEKKIKATVTAPEVPPAPVSAITIDGEFSDWSALKAGTFSRFVNDPESPWEAVEEIRCYADENYVFYYAKYNAEYLAELLENPAEILPIRFNFNTDGEFQSGYKNYFLEHYDLIIEGQLAENGAFCKFVQGELNQHIGEWVKLAGEDVELMIGLGSGSAYEFRLDRALFNKYAKTSEDPMPMGDEFQTSIRFYFINAAGKWDQLSNMPNSSINEEQGNGYGYLMRVKTNK